MIPEQKIARHINQPIDYQRAKSLRKNAPLAERLLWDSLRRLPKEPVFNFRRQHPIHPYIADFICTNPRLVIEIDGMSHDSCQYYDARRDAFLKEQGYAVLHFSDNDVLSNSDGVALTVWHTLIDMKADPG